MINVPKLTDELTEAGIPNGGCAADGVVWAVDGETEIQDQSNVMAVIAAHDPVDYVVARRESAAANAAAATLLATITTAEAIEWIDNNIALDVTAEQATFYRMLVRLVLAIRDRIFAELRGQIAD